MRELPSRKKPWIKICGMKTEDDIVACIESGATHVGLNLYAPSPRSVTLEHAQQLRRIALGRISTVVLMVEPTIDELKRAEDALGPDWFQVHGDRAVDVSLKLKTPIFRALGLRDAQDLRSARDLADPFLLIDAKDDTVHGGTGRLAPTDLARELCRERACLLAGGLDPLNVTQQVERVKPLGVDVASGVEETRGDKAHGLISSFCSASISALQALKETSSVESSK